MTFSIRPCSSFSTPEGLFNFINSQIIELSEQSISESFEKMNVLGNYYGLTDDIQDETSLMNHCVALMTR